MALDSPAVSITFFFHPLLCLSRLDFSRFRRRSIDPAASPPPPPGTKKSISAPNVYSSVSIQTRVSVCSWCLCLCQHATCIITAACLSGLIWRSPVIPHWFCSLAPLVCWLYLCNFTVDPPPPPPLSLLSFTTAYEGCKGVKVGSSGTQCESVKARGFRPGLNIEG